MKVKKYEEKEIIITLCIAFFIISIFLIIFLYQKKEYKYKEFAGIVLEKNLIIAVVDKNTRENIYDNSFLYLNSKKKKYKIVEDRGVIIRKDKNKYYELLLEIKFDKNYKLNDSLTLSIKTEKMRLIEIFKIIWEGG